MKIYNAEELRGITDALERGHEAPRHVVKHLVEDIRRYRAILVLILEAAEAKDGAGQDHLHAACDAVEELMESGESPCIEARL